MTSTQNMQPSAAVDAALVGDVARSDGTRMRAAQLLSVATLVLMVVATAAGLLVDGLYQEPDSVSAMLRGYDLVGLVLVAPALAVGVAGARRGSARAHLLWLGTLAATVYTYTYYLFITAFNDLFLVHAALFSSALFALVFALSATDVSEIAERFTARTPARLISGFLALAGAGLGIMWIYYALRFALTNELPMGSLLVETDALVHFGFVMDLTVLVPVYLFAAVLLWRRAPWGYVLAAICVISGVVHQIGYMVALPFQVIVGVPGAEGFDLNEPVIAAGFLITAIVLLLSVHDSRGRASTSG